MLLGDLAYDARFHNSHRGTCIHGWMPNLVVKQEGQKNGYFICRDADVTLVTLPGRHLLYTYTTKSNEN